MERYRGRVPLRSRAHDLQAAAGRGDPPAPAGLKRRKGTGYFLSKYTSEGIQRLPSVQPQVEPVQQTPLAYSNVPSHAVNRTLSAGLQPELSLPAADGDAAARRTCPAYLLSVASSPVPFFSGSCTEGFLFPLSYAAMSPFIRSREVSRGAEEQHRLLAVFPRHVGSIHSGLREQNYPPREVKPLFYKMRRRGQ